MNSTNKKIQQLEELKAENERLVEQNTKLRNAISKIAENLQNGSVVSPLASIEFLTEDVPNEVRLVVNRYKTQSK